LFAHQHRRRIANRSSRNGYADRGALTEQVKRLKDLETENARLRRAISDLTLDKLILQEAAKGNY